MSGNAFYVKLCNFVSSDKDVAGQVLLAERQKGGG